MALIITLFIVSLSLADSYDIGTPSVINLYVNETTGSDSNSGTSSSSPLRTISAAWNQIPRGSPLSIGYKINLLSSEHTLMPHYWEERYGTFNHPIIISGSGNTVLRGDMNVYDVRYLYVTDLTIRPGGDAFHCEKCDHVLLKNVTLDGGSDAHETLKVNQSQYFYIENSDIGGAGDNAVDFVAVQYGHIRNTRIHDAGDWCLYLKGGSAYFTVEGSRIYNCGTGGFTAGQGTGFEFMTSPWLHYEAYDLKFINNLVYDTEGACFGVNGGYNILIAHNSCARVGSRSHVAEVVFGLRSCDGDASACESRRLIGGWGINTIGDPGVQPIPNRNVYIYNNLIINQTASAWQHFAIYGPRTPNVSSNIPNPARTDTNLQIKGNIIWNGSSSHPLGIEDSSEGCRNDSCNETQLRADNHINTFEPDVVDLNSNDLRPLSGILAISGVVIPSFSGGDRVSTPLAPEGDLTNQVLKDRSGGSRGSARVIGAYSSTDAPLDQVNPTIRRARCIVRGGRFTYKIKASHPVGILKVQVGQKVLTLRGELYKRTLRKRRGFASAYSVDGGSSRRRVSFIYR